MARLRNIRRLAMGLMTHLVRSASIEGIELLEPATIPYSCLLPFMEFGL
jgi:hypothetical protein